MSVQSYEPSQPPLEDIHSSTPLVKSKPNSISKSKSKPSLITPLDDKRFSIQGFPRFNNNITKLKPSSPRDLSNLDSTQLPWSPRHSIQFLTNLSKSLTTWNSNSINGNLLKLSLRDSNRDSLRDSMRLPLRDKFHHLPSSPSSYSPTSPHRTSFSPNLLSHRPVRSTTSLRPYWFWTSSTPTTTVHYLNAQAVLPEHLRDTIRDHHFDDVLERGFDRHPHQWTLKFSLTPLLLSDLLEL